MRFPTHFEHSNPFNEAILDSSPKFQLLMIKNKHSYMAMLAECKRQPFCSSMPLFFPLRGPMTFVIALCRRQNKSTIFHFKGGLHCETGGGDFFTYFPEQHLVSLLSTVPVCYKHSFKLCFLGRFVSLYQGY